MRIAKVALVVSFVALLSAAAQGQELKRPPKSQPTPLPNKPPSVKLVSSAERVVLLSGCADTPAPPCTPSNPKVELLAEATDPDKDTVLYTYTSKVGRLEADGPEATLDLTGVAHGTYAITVEVDDGNGGVATGEIKITIEHCTCSAPLTISCPTVTVSGPHFLSPDTPNTYTYKASITGGDPAVTPTYNWTVSADTITSGQGTGSIMVARTGARPACGASYSATVDVGGYDRSCKTSASASLIDECPIRPRKVDEYGNIEFNEEKARLDQFLVALQNDPSAQGYVICYGGSRSRLDEAQRRCDRARDYLVRTREPSRFVTVDGGFREESSAELWLVPSGGTPPQATPTVDPKEVRPPAPPRSSRDRRRR